MNYDRIFKILLIGDSGTGKSNILLRYCDDYFCENFISTIGVDFKIKTLNVQDSIVKLQIWDTAGQERFSTITRNYYRHSDGIFIVYDVTNRASFDNISKWMKSIDENSNSNVVRYLIGNKSDLKQERCVSYEEGESLALRYGIGFLETSAKERINVDEVFQKLIEFLIRRNKVMEKNTSQSKVLDSNQFQGISINPSSCFNC